MRISTETRLYIEHLIDKIRAHDPVTLEERVRLYKYSVRIPFIARKLKDAIEGG